MGTDRPKAMLMPVQQVNRKTRSTARVNRRLPGARPRMAEYTALRLRPGLRPT